MALHGCTVPAVASLDVSPARWAMTFSPPDFHRVQRDARAVHELAAHEWGGERSRALEQEKCKGFWAERKRKVCGGEVSVA